ncbi:CST complex subunit CTC1 isoform X2 [Astyanax mexicanus]|uniref:CST complex subunit CTC1 isoform X2 n=1 Tax=Astyanax mexicanus TaxID=7994 RepID=UPI0020CB236E|nr:CST complex subunit CTC1 isoform X2 [Astyanax mexicanus]
MDEFLDPFKDCTRVEQAWLGDLYAAVRDWIHPAVGTSLGWSVEKLAETVLWIVRRTTGSQSLPVSYKLVSVSELLSRQRSPCCSSLTWSTSHYRERAREAEQALPNHKALPRTQLLLIGFLCDGRISGQCNGCWRLRDVTGSVHCEVLNSSPLWLGKLMLLPTWNYIPQNALGKELGGYLELIDSPVCVTSGPTELDPGEMLNEVIGVRKAARILRQRGSGRGCVCVCGEVRVVCPLLVIAGKCFFCFILAEEDASVPILVTDPECVHWRQCVCVGQSVCITALRVCSVRGWAGHRVLSVTPCSHLRLNPHTEEQRDNTHSQSDTLAQSDSHTQSQIETQSDTASPTSHESTQVEAQSLSDSHTQSLTGTHTLDTHLQQESGDLAQMDADPPARRKVSKIISYRGLITSVLNAEAGLYEIDGKVGLCLAYQPQRKLSGGLRPGAEIELQNVHFLFRPTPFGPDAMLCLCLRSSVCVRAFSPLRSKISTPRSDSPLLCYLLERNLGVSEYLWLCYCHTALTERLCPRWVCEARVCVVAGRLLQFALGEEEKRGKQKRDIYREMIQDPHTCPLTEYSVSRPHVSVCSLKELCDWMEKECWESLSLSSLVPPSAPYLAHAQLNPLLCWSTHTLPLRSCSTHTLCPPLLVGVLEASSSRASVRLMDQTAAVDCVCVESSQSGDQLATINTAWLGCLVCIRNCTLVMERFLKTDFPSWKHLDQQRYITHKHCRVYIQVCVKDMHILSPSASMTIFSSEGKREGEGGVMEEQVEGVQKAECSDKTSHTGRIKRKRESEERREGHNKKNRDRSNYSNGPDDAEGSASMMSVPCVTLLLRVDTKQGVAFRNLQTANQTQGLKLSFTVKVTCLGDVQRWDRDPRNEPMEEREGAGGERKMELQFVDSSVRWFPLLQPGSVYRLTALNTEDVSVLCGSTVPAKGGVTLLSSPSLLVQPQWRIHTLTQLLLSEQIQGMMSVSDVLRCSSEVVSLYGVISERITLEEEKGKTPALRSLISDKEQSVEQGLRVRLTLQDSEAPDRSLQVYLDLSHVPYIPGLIPGATVLLHDFQRKVSVVKNVYCWSLPVSCLTVTGLGSLKPRPPPPMMHLGQWAPGRAGQSIVGRVRSHVVCVLSLQLKWVCSFCGSVFKQSVCTRTCPPCDSNTGIFQAEAKVAIEDGTGEAQVWFSTETVAELLSLAATDWEGLQRHVRVRGHLRVYARGRNMVCDVDPDDPLVQYLCCLCSSSAVCRQFTLTCRLRSHKPEKGQLRKVCRGEREFLTKFPQALQLHCTHIHTSNSTP